jgi:hypothetical protein
MLKLNFGVRQGGVLSPYLFAVYIDDIIETVVKQQIGCVCIDHLLYYSLCRRYTVIGAIC